MSASLLKYYTKQSSVPLMELSFNSDYESLLSELERYAEDDANSTYAEIYLILASTSISQLDKLPQITEALNGLIQRIHLRANSTFGDWYLDSFGHLASGNLEDIARRAEFDLQVERIARSSAASIGMASTAERTFDKDGSQEEFVSSLSKRVANTESNGAAGSVIATTALVAFGSANLYKRWITVGDERVRDTHRAVATRKPIKSDQLYMVGGTFMRFPADPNAFGGNVAGEVINCRCRSLVMPKLSGLLSPNNSFSLNNFLGGGL